MVEAPSAYNVILGRPTLNQAKVVESTNSLVVKFLTPQGVGILRGDQDTTRSCYVTSLCRSITFEALNMEEMDPREEKEGVSPAKELIDMILDPERPDRLVCINSVLELEDYAKLTKFLKKNQDVFAWSHKDMPGIDPQEMSH